MPGHNESLATWCEEPTLEKTLMLGKIEGRRRRFHLGIQTDKIII